MKTNAAVRRFAVPLGLLAASVGSLAIAAEPKPGDVIENSIKMKLAYIPPGEFEMGSPESEEDTGKKLHHVKLTKGFYLGAYEVTQSQFQRVQKRNPSWYNKDGGGNAIVLGKDTTSFPVEMVTWFDAAEYCNALSKSEGLREYYTLRKIARKDDSVTDAEVEENGGTGYRLPTEAEWEYACRAGTTSRFHTGDTLTRKQANISLGGKSRVDVLKSGSFPPNAWGLYDMHGNVAEWCNDWYKKYEGEAVDPKGAGVGETRVLRGGSFTEVAPFTRSADRDLNMPGDRYCYIGFRVARTYAVAP